MTTTSTLTDSQRFALACEAAVEAFYDGGLYADHETLDAIVLRFTTSPIVFGGGPTDWANDDDVAALEEAVYDAVRYESERAERIMDRR